MKNKLVSDFQEAVMWNIRLIANSQGLNVKFQTLPTCVDANFFSRESKAYENKNPAAVGFIRFNTVGFLVWHSDDVDLSGVGAMAKQINDFIYDYELNYIINGMTE